MPQAMKMTENKRFGRGLKPLSREEMNFLIYMTSDIWITPEIRRFKNDLIDRAGS